MARAEKTVSIRRPAKQVYDFILQGANNPLWRPGVMDIAQSGGPIGVGATFKQGMKGPGGRRIDADYAIVEAKPPTWIKFEVTAGPARPTGTYSIEAQGDTTRVTFVLDFQPQGLARLMDGMINRQMKEEVGTLDNLKAHLEGKAA